MRIVRIILYVLKQGIKNIGKNFYMIFASICVMFVALFLLSMLQLASVNLQSVLDDLSDKSEIRLNCYPSITDAESISIQNKLQEDPRVVSVNRISRAENFEATVAMFKDQEDLFKGYADDPSFMYVSFDVKLKDAGYGDSFVKDAAAITGIEKIVTILNVISLFRSLKFWIQIGTVVALLIMGSLAVLLIMNTIKLTVMARKNELEIMKYIGASKTYIRGPFIMEGVFIGTISALLSYYATKVFYRVLLERFAGSQLGGIINLMPFSEVGKNMALYFILIGIVVGVFTSGVAIKKYIKV